MRIRRSYVVFAAAAGEGRVEGCAFMGESGGGFVGRVAEGFPGAEGGDGEFAAELVVAVAVFVFLQDGELDAVDGEQFVEGQAEGEGGKGVEFDQGLAAGVVGAQWAVAGPGRCGVRPGDVERLSGWPCVAAVGVGQRLATGAGGLLVGVG